MDRYYAPAWPAQFSMPIADMSLYSDSGSSYRRTKASSSQSSQSARRREQRERPVYYVPDPPAWSSSEVAVYHYNSEDLGLLSPISSPEPRNRSKDVKKPSRSSRRPRSVAAESQAGTYTEPPTPEIPRLDTPDLDDLDQPFCDCKSCRRKSKHGDQKSKLDSQLNAARQHIRSSTRDDGRRVSSNSSR